MTIDFLRRFAGLLRSILIASLFALAVPASAGTPSYVGPWVYATGATNEADDLAFHLAGMQKSYPPPCTVQVRWSVGADWVNDGAPIEGVYASSWRYYDYNHTEWDYFYTNHCAAPGPWYIKAFQSSRTRVVCSSTQRFLDSKCVNVTAIDSPGRKGSNFGPKCPNCGQPISISTGNMWHIEVDYADRPGGDLGFSRTYNSLASNTVRPHLLGSRWTTEYDAAMRPITVSMSYSDTQCYRRADNGAIFCEGTVVPNAVLQTAAAVQVQRGDGKNYVFNRSGTSFVGATADTVDQLSAIYAADNSITGFRYVDARSGATEVYDASGLLLSISARTGSTRHLTYSDGNGNNTSLGRYPGDAPACTQVDEGPVLPFGRLLCVTDDWGRQLNFTYDDHGRVKSVTDPSGKLSLYEYDGATGGCLESAPGSLACSANNLTKLTHPDGTVRQYAYNESPNVNGGGTCASVTPIGNGFAHLLYSMTGLIDEKGIRHISWGYDCSGYAISSQLAGGVEKFTIANTFDASTPGLLTANAVTTSVGSASAPQTVTSTFTPKLVLGDYKNASISVQCPVCGTIRSRTFDANGNVTFATDFNGINTTYSYDLTRNLETSRTEGYNTTVARTISTTWHPTLRLPTGIAEPRRITSLTYDDHGNVLTRTVQATSDLTGASGFGATAVGTARVWRYEYNTHGQLTKETGPRTDVADVTTYDYDVKGNLATITNALGQATTFSGYDDNGLVGSMLEPNGTLIEFTYTARGKLASRTVSNGASHETTSYEYDPVGQLTKVTNADGSWFGYGYDDAHRLTSVTDSLGNSVVYTLDLLGNRIAEQVKDPSGVLTRQISRVFDTRNQLTSVTGANQ